MGSSRRWALVLAAVLCTACSSAPPVPEGVHDRKNRAADYLKFGRQAFQEAQYDQALSFYLIAVDLNTAVDYTAGMAASWNSVATAQAALGKHAEVRAALSQAEALAALSGDKALILQVAVNAAQAELTSGDTAGARKRLESLKPYPATAEGAALDHALGTLEKEEEHFPEALAAFERALAVNSSLKLKQEAASNRFMKASVLGKLGRWDEAQAELTAALDLDRMMENTAGIGQDLRALGTVALRRDKPQEAIDYYLRASRLFQAAGLSEEQKKTLELLIPVLRTFGPPGEAQKYQALADRLAPARP